MQNDIQRYVEFPTSPSILEGKVRILREEDTKKCEFDVHRKVVVRRMEKQKFLGNVNSLFTFVSLFS